MELKFPERMSEDLAEIFGVIVGDGYIKSKPNWWLFIETAAQERVYIDRHLIPLFNRVFGTKLKGRFFNRNGVNNTYGFYICSNPLVNYLGEFGLNCYHNYIRVPEIIRESNDRKLFASFIRGYFDTDGCISFYKPNKTLRHTYPRIQINSTSESLIKDYKRMVEFIGLKGSYWKTKVFRKQKSVPHRYEIKGKGMLDKWMNVIGMANEIKMSKYLVWREFGVLPPYTTHNERVKMLKGYINPQKYYTGARSSVG